MITIKRTINLPICTDSLARAEPTCWLSSLFKFTVACIHKISLLIIEWGYPICYNYSGYNNYIYTTLWIIIMFVSGIIKCWSSKTGGLRRRCKNNTLIDLTKIPYNKNGALCVAFSRGKHSLRFQVKQK